MDFVCKCGKRQREKTPKGIITEKDLERFGWRKINGEWICPICCNNTANLNNINEIHDCSCAACTEGIKKLEERERKNIKEFGWYAHIVMDDSNCPYNYNIHTHGMRENFNHPDLQMCVPIDPKIAHIVICNIIKQIKNGVKYKIGEPIIDDKIVEKDFPFLFVEARECNRDVLRIIISDKYKNLDRKTMELSEQWEGTTFSNLGINNERESN